MGIDYEPLTIQELFSKKTLLTYVNAQFGIPLDDAVAISGKHVLELWEGMTKLNPAIASLELPTETKRLLSSPDEMKK